MDNKLYNEEAASSSIEECFANAKELALKELQALKDGDVEQAEQCLAKRTKWQEAAMRFSSTHPQELREGLLEMSALQAELIQEGKELRAKLVGSLNNAKAQGRRLRGYKQAVGQALY